MQILNFPRKVLKSEQQTSAFAMILCTFLLPLHNGIDNCRHNCWILHTYCNPLAFEQGAQAECSISFRRMQRAKKMHPIFEIKPSIESTTLIDSCLHSQLPRTPTQSIYSLAIFNSLLHDFRCIFIESVHKLFGTIILKRKNHIGKKTHASEKKRDGKEITMHNVIAVCKEKCSRAATSMTKRIALSASAQTCQWVYVESNTPYPLSSIEDLM